MQYPWIQPTITSQVASPSQQFTTANGTITGVIDGNNTVFRMGVESPRAMIWRNGLFMTLNLDCSFSGRTIVFSAAQTPQVGDVITAFA